MIRRCVLEDEMSSILNHCHTLPCGGNFGGQRTVEKVLQSSFYWPSLFKDAHLFVSTYDKCQRSGNISKKDEPPTSTILEFELFDLWGMDFMGPFPSSFSHLYILLVVDYVSKWVEAIPTHTNDASVVAKFLCNHIFCHAPNPGPTRLADPNRVRGARLKTGTLFFFFQNQPVPMGMAHIL